MISLEGMEVREPKAKGSTFVDRSGVRFGFLEAVRLLGFKKQFAIWLCRCTRCGHEMPKYGHQLSKHNSCDKCNGIQSRFSADKNHPLYGEWRRKSTRLCETWHDFTTFCAEVGEQTAPYLQAWPNTDAEIGPGNFRWADASQVRTNLHIIELTYNGETMSMTAWAGRLGITRQRLEQRLNAMPVEEALSYSRCDSGEAIARRMAKRQQARTYYEKRNGTTVRPHKAARERNETIAAAFAEGKSRRKIAAEFGLSYATVCQAIRFQTVDASMSPLVQQYAREVIGRIELTGEPSEIAGRVFALAEALAAEHEKRLAKPTNGHQH